MTAKMTRHICILAFSLAASNFLSGCAGGMRVFETPISTVGADYIEPTSNTPFVFVKGGEFEMGGLFREDQQPVHKVTISDIFVGMYEVTFAQYDQFCAATNCEPPNDSGWGRGTRPVINVSWHDANAYAKWLSEQTGRHFRLPSESEWEYFARAGTTTEFWTGSTLPKGGANCEECGSKWDGESTAPVGSFLPNPLGLYDTAGNVLEWVQDHYQGSYKNAPRDESPVRDQATTDMGQRGGSWKAPITDLRSSSRGYRSMGRTTNDVGFRLVLLPEASQPPSAQK